jgi:hypothetical protein
MKKFIFTIVGMVGGAIAGTAITFAALYRFGQLFPGDGGSLLDQSHDAANLFAVIWIAISVICATLACIATRRPLR